MSTTARKLRAAPDYFEPEGAEAAARVRVLSGGKLADRARCPAHDDENPSLSIKAGAKGKVLVHCRAGCTQDAMIAKLKEMGLWPTSCECRGRRGARA